MSCGAEAAPGSEPERGQHLGTTLQAPACASVSLCSGDLPRPFVSHGGRGVRDPEQGWVLSPMLWVAGTGVELWGSLPTCPPSAMGKLPCVPVAAKGLFVSVLAGPLSPCSHLPEDTPPTLGLRTLILQTELSPPHSLPVVLGPPSHPH